jgi:hypothetical protein
MTVIRDRARELIEAGYSVIPVKEDKRSYGRWKQYQEQAMSVEDVEKNFNGAPKIALVGGSVSGNLEDLDIDDKDLFSEISDVLHTMFPDYIENMVFFKTPNGYGIAWRCEEEVEGNLKLAYTWDVVDEEGEYEWNDRTSLKAFEYKGSWVVSGCRLESRGTGGYFLVHPSEGYEILEGSFDGLRPIPASVRTQVLNFARTYDQRPVSDDVQVVSVDPDLPKIKRIGDVFNEEVDFEGLLLEGGWKKSGKTAKGLTFTRPGKSAGVGGQLMLDNRFHVYSSNAAPLVEGKQYSPLSFYMITEHDGDYKNGIKKLVEVGYEVNMSVEEVKEVLGGNPEEIDNAYNYSGLRAEQVTDIIVELGLTLPAGRSPGKKVIRYNNTELNRVVRESDSALASVAGEWGYYNFMGELGYVVEHKETGSAGITEKYRGFMAYDMDSLELRLEQSAGFEVLKGKGESKHWYPDRCPVHVVRKLFSYPNSSSKLITGFSSHPTVGADGNVFGLGSGYEQEVYFTHGGGYSVSELSFRECYDYVVDSMCKDILFDPERKQLMEAAYVSMLMVGVIRATFGGGCPGYLFNANEPGTGKSTAIQMAMNVILGRDVATIPWKYDQEDRVKALTAALRTGKEVVLWDNLSFGTSVDDGLLAEILTAGSYMDRILGKTKMLDIPCHNLFILGGNGLTMSTELARRLVVIDLKAQVANPASRKVSDNDIIATVRNKRYELFGCLLRMIQLGVNMPKKIEKNSGCGTFWDTMVRNPLMHELGVDIMDAMGSESGASDEVSTKDTAIELLRDLYAAEGETEFTARHLFNWINSEDEVSGQLTTEVKDILTEINARAWISVKSLGRALGVIADRVSSDGTMIVKHKTAGHPIKYVFKW